MSHATKSDRYVVRVKAQSSNVERALGAIPGVTNTITRPAGEWLVAEVTAGPGSDIGEKIFSCAVDNGWKLSELKHETASLEDVFTQLTKG